MASKVVGTEWKHRCWRLTCMIAELFRVIVRSKEVRSCRRKCHYRKKHEGNLTNVLHGVRTRTAANAKSETTLAVAVIAVSRRVIVTSSGISRPSAAVQAS